MKQTKHLQASVVSAVLLVPSLSHAAITVANSGSITPDADDVSYLPGSVNEADTMTFGDNSASGNNDALTYVAADRTSKGQSFTTGSNALGYSIDTVSIQHIGWESFTENGTFYSIVDGDTFDFRFGTFSGSTLTPTFTGTATYSGATVEDLSATSSGTGSFFTFDVSGEGIAPLLADTNYFFEIASGTGDPFLELNSTAVDGYAGGTAFAGDDVSALDADNTVSLPPNDGDFAFNVGLTAVPEPSAALLGGLGILGLLRRRRA